jgi:hypothetical protein
VRIAPATFGLKQGTLDSARRQAATARRAQQKLAPHLQEYEELAGRRLSLGLQLLGVPSIQARVEDGAALLAERDRLLRVAVAFPSIIEALLPAEETFAVVAAIATNLSEGRASEKHGDALRRQVPRLHQRLVAVHSSLGGLAYPFEHGQGRRTLEEQVLPYLPPAEELGDMMEATQRCLEGLSRLQGRVLTRLASIAHQVESALRRPRDPAASVAPS